MLYKTKFPIIFLIRYQIKHNCACLDACGLDCVAGSGLSRDDEYVAIHTGTRASAVWEDLESLDIMNEGSNWDPLK